MGILRFRRLCLFAVGFVMALSVASSGAVAQGPPSATKHHKILQNDVGVWDVECQMWMGPEAPPFPFQAVEKNHVLEGGLWLVSNFTSDFGPQKFEGHGIFGYDTHEKKYVGTWIDNMGTTASHMEGSYDADKKILTMKSEGRDPATGKMVPMENVTRYINDNEKVFEMHVAGKGGKMWKMMEMKYTRRK